MNYSASSNQPQPYATVPDELLASLVRAIGDADAQDPLSCAECRAQLPALYHLTLEGSQLPAHCQAARTHLEFCSACAAEYAALQAVLGALAMETLPSLATEPIFDLSFIDSSLPVSSQTATAPPSIAGPSAPLGSLGISPPLWRQGLETSVWQLFAEVQIWLRTAGATFGVLPTPLASSPVALNGGAAFRSDVPAGQPEVLVLPAPDARISIHLAVGPMVAGSAAVMVKLLAMPSEQPLGEIRVMLRNAQHQLLMGLVTRPDGTAIFEQLPLGHYIVQVRYAQNTWEIPLVVVAGSPPM
ncbi:MAG: hypothetical protein IPK16_10005 [Anaerolineales bacterium]|nr:hypothetical protein [Anaerolineales bacterium]